MDGQQFPGTEAVTRQFDLCTVGGADFVRPGGTPRGFFSSSSPVSRFEDQIPGGSAGGRCARGQAI